jgi:ADP-ribose pyrophosphatase
VSDTDAPPPWPIESSEVDREYSIFTVRRERVRSPRTGELHDFLVVQPSDAVAVVALTPSDELVLVEQYRLGTRENTLELPGGVLHGDDPLAAARRELREETGYAGAELALLGTVDLNPSWQTTRIHLVLATGAVPAGAREEDAGEDIRVRVVPLARARRMAAEGGIRNAVALAGLQLLGARRGG